jgi:pimeloyl-ACP methyl ester carboxylesterase
MSRPTAVLCDAVPVARARLAVSFVALALLVPGAATARVVVPTDTSKLVRSITIHYRAHDGSRRSAIVLLPVNVSLTRPLPLIISPHGRGVGAVPNARLWGDLPGRYQFAVVNPQGEGRKLGLYSWGWRGEINDLARMPQIVAHALPRVSIDRSRIYAFGGSMGGQEVLLLVATHPGLLRGAAAFDPAVDMSERYRAFGRMKNGRHIQELARQEIGGTPRQVPRAYAARSPLHYIDEIADSNVPLQIWWSTRDRVIRGQARGAGLLFKRIKEANQFAPVVQCRGMWRHTVEMESTRRLPAALGHFGLRWEPGTIVWGHRTPPDV